MPFVKKALYQPVPYRPIQCLVYTAVFLFILCATNVNKNAAINKEKFHLKDGAKYSSNFQCNTIRLQDTESVKLVTSQFFTSPKTLQRIPTLLFTVGHMR